MAWWVSRRARPRRPGAGMAGRARQAKEKVMLRSLATLKARNRRPWMLLALPAAAAAAALVVGCSSSGTSSGGSSGGSSGHAAPAAGGLQTATIGGATVLTNSNRFTVYSFALD